MPFLLFVAIVLLSLTEHQKKSNKDHFKVTQWKKDTGAKPPLAVADMKVYWGTEVFILMVSPHLLYHGVVAALG